jgi:hypothetical protein
MMTETRPVSMAAQPTAIGAYVTSDLELHRPHTTRFAIPNASPTHSAGHALPPRNVDQ